MPPQQMTRLVLNALAAKLSSSASSHALTSNEQAKKGFAATAEGFRAKYDSHHVQQHDVSFAGVCGIAWGSVERANARVGRFVKVAYSSKFRQNFINKPNKKRIRFSFGLDFEPDSDRVRLTVLEDSAPLSRLVRKW